MVLLLIRGLNITLETLTLVMHQPDTGAQDNVEENLLHG